MKTRLDYMLFCLQEECSEVQKVASKMARFGHLSVGPDTSLNNMELMRDEVHDILGAYLLVCKELGIDMVIDKEKIEAKTKRIERFMQYSINDGLVEDSRRSGQSDVH